MTNLPHIANAQSIVQVHALEVIVGVTRAGDAKIQPILRLDRLYDAQKSAMEILQAINSAIEAEIALTPTASPTVERIRAAGEGR
jgi:hypothetical protein